MFYSNNFYLTYKNEIDFIRLIVRYHHFHFQGAIHAYLTGDNFEEVIRQTIKAGGCNCSRALFAGAMAGARESATEVY